MSWPGSSKARLERKRAQVDQLEAERAGLQPDNPRVAEINSELAHLKRHDARDSTQSIIGSRTMSVAGVGISK